MAEGDIVIRKLALSSAGNGTISGFAFAEEGVLDVAAFAGQTQELSVTLSDCTGFANLSGWSVGIDGEVTSRYRCSAKADGTVCVFKKGIVFTIR